MSAPHGDRIWFDTDQAAAYAGCHPDTVRKALAAGDLRGVQRKKRGHWRMKREWLDTWLAGGGSDE